jgi:hypothetical protein
LPSGATHIILKSGFASINFMTGESEMIVSAPVRLAVNAEAQAALLKPATVPTIEGTQFILLSIDFVQAVNNVDYSLNNNAYNVLAVCIVLKFVYRFLLIILFLVYIYNFIFVPSY